MKRLLVLLIATLVMAGCAGTTTLKTENDKVRKVPSWYVDHEEISKEGWLIGARTEYVYTVAEDVSPSMEMGIRKATLKAKAKLADKVVGEINNRTIYTYSEHGDPLQPVGVAQAQDTFVNVIRKTVLKYYEIEKRDIIFNPQLRNYRTFVLVKISKERLDETASVYSTKVAQTHAGVAPQSFDDIAEEILTQ